MYDGGGPAKGGAITLFVDGKAVGDGRIERTEPGIFSADETCDIGTEFGSAVTGDYGERAFNGVVNWVELAVGDDAKQVPDQERHVFHARGQVWRIYRERKARGHVLP